MPFNWPGILAAALAFLPPGLLLLWRYGRYDGEFRDNVVFLNLVGGMAIGLVAAAFLLFLTVQPAGAEGAPRSSLLMFVAGFALLVPLAITAVVNRRKWQGERHAIWNGGALGAGAASMMTLTLWRTRFPEIALEPALGLLAGAVTLTLLLAAVGYLVGAGVLDRRPFRGLGLAALVSLPFGFFVYAFLVMGLWPWILFGVVAAAALYAWADRTLLPRALGPEGLRRRRRAARARAPE